MIIRLAKERFWVEAAYSERWPQMLLKLPDGDIPVRAKRELAHRYWREQADAKGRLSQYEMFGLFGAEHKPGGVGLHGCNLLKATERGYRLSAAALRLRDAYDNSGTNCTSKPPPGPLRRRGSPTPSPLGRVGEGFPGNDKWEILLMEQALRYSLRLRALTAALLDGGELAFPNAFLTAMPQARLTYGGRSYAVFNTFVGQHENLNALLLRLKSVALGPFWRAELGLGDDDDFDLYGGHRQEPPSVNQIATHLKPPLALMEHLGWFAEIAPAVFRLDAAAMQAALADDAYASLRPEAQNELDILRELIHTYANLKGYFPVALVGALLKQRIDPHSDLPDDKWTDRYFSAGFHGGTFELADYDMGQPMDGRGLLGRNSHQLVKLEIF